MNRYVFLLGVVLTGFLAVGMFQAKSGAERSAKEIDRLELEIARVKADIKSLEDRHGELTNPDRLARLAKEHLNMGPARSSQMVDASQPERAFGPLIDHGDHDG